MKKTKAFTALLLSVSFGLTACETTGGGPTSQDVGMILGALGGAYLGSQVGSGSGKTAATVLGAVLGGYAGRAIARKLTQQDHAYMNDATYRAVSTNTPQNWSNANSGASGSVTPTGTFVQSGQNCTRFSQTVSAGGETGNGNAVACQMPDGTWQVRSA